MVAHFFPSVGLQALSSLVHFLGVTIVTHCLSRRLVSVGFSPSALFALPWPRLCLLLVFFDSWAFLFTGGVLIFGVGLELSHSICNGAILLCIACYATSKVLIYFFLIERVHVVWAPAAGRSSRFKSPVDRLCFLTISPYCVIIVLLLVGRIAELRTGDQACVIGLKPIASIPLLTYDMYINLFLTGLFFWPLFRSGHLSPKVKRLAVRTLVASVAALATSTINIALLTTRNGREYGWVCLGSCGADVIANAVALYWATLPKNRDQGPPISSDDVEIIFTPKPTSRGVSNPPEPGTCIQELRSMDHLTKNPQPQATRTAQSNLLATPPPCHGIFQSVSRILKRAEARKLDKKHQIEVTVTTHCEVDGEIVLPQYTSRESSISPSSGRTL